MTMQQHSNSAKAFIESAVPVAVIGERKLRIKIKDETEIEKQLVPFAFVFPMPNNLNLYASSFVHGILVLQKCLKLNRRQVIGLVSIVPFCNDPYRFYASVHRIAHLKIQDDPYYKPKPGVYAGKDKDMLFGRNIAFSYYYWLVTALTVSLMIFTHPHIHCHPSLRTGTF
jgi:hypothetical protein